MSNDTLLDRLQVGAFFGVLGGIVSLVIVLAWTALERLWGPGAPFPATLALHGGYLALYAVAGALIGAFWPVRRRLAGRLLLWLIGSAAFTVSIATVSYGPPWGWSFGECWRSALAAAGFAGVFGWPERRRGA